MLVSLIISFDIILKFLLNKLISSVYFVKKNWFFKKKIYWLLYECYENNKFCENLI